MPGWRIRSSASAPTPEKVLEQAVRRALVIVAAVLTVGLPACAGGTTSAAEGTDATLPALCDALAAPDAAEAGTVFESRAHQPLHQLADEVAGVDRGVAADLLEAKFAVETVVREDVGAPDALVHQRLEDLTAQVRRALATLDRPAPAC